MDQRDTRLDEELRKGAQYLAHRLTPTAGTIPRIPGIDIHGVSLPLNGVAGGDLLSYVDFQARFDLDSRIQRARGLGQEDMARVLQKLKNTGGILVADVAGHDFTDAARAAMLHQAFHTGALYEMDLNGQITLRLFEQINTRFCKSSTLRNLAADPDEASYITLIYGEISNTGRFSFVSAGHPPPLVFSREFDRFVEVSQDRLVSYPPIGLQPGEHHADAKRYERALGYKKRYTVNNLNLHGPRRRAAALHRRPHRAAVGRIRQDQLAQAVSRAKARERADDLRGDRARPPGRDTPGRRPHARRHRDR